jgi:hypothetical protein
MLACTNVRIEIGLSAKASTACFEEEQCTALGVHSDALRKAAILLCV